MTTASKPLTLDQLLREEAPIFVRNNVSPAGQIIIEFKDSSGKAYPFCIPRTWVPIDVTSSIPRSVIDSCMDFRTRIRNGTLKLLQPEEAQKEVESEEGIEELARIYKSTFSKDAKFVNAAATDMMAAAMAKIDANRKQAADVNVQTEDKGPEITPSVYDIVGRVNNKSLDGKAALNEFRCILQDITLDDCTYIIANCDGKVREWAKGHLETLS